MTQVNIKNDFEWIDVHVQIINPVHKPLKKLRRFWGDVHEHAILHMMRTKTDAKIPSHLLVEILDEKWHEEEMGVVVFPSKGAFKL